MLLHRYPMDWKVKIFITYLFIGAWPATILQHGHSYVTFLALSTSPQGSLFLKSIPVSGVPVGGRRMEASIVKYSTFKGRDCGNTEKNTKSFYFFTSKFASTYKRIEFTQEIFDLWLFFCRLQDFQHSEVWIIMVQLYLKEDFLNVFFPCKKNNQIEKILSTNVSRRFPLYLLIFPFYTCRIQI